MAAVNETRAWHVVSTPWREPLTKMNNMQRGEVIKGADKTGRLSGGGGAIQVRWEG